MKNSLAILLLLALPCRGEPTDERLVISVEQNISEKCLLVRYTNPTSESASVLCHQGIPFDLSFEIWHGDQGYRFRPEALIRIARLGGFVTPLSLKVEPKSDHTFKIPLSALSTDTMPAAEATKLLQGSLHDNLPTHVRACDGTLVSKMIAMKSQDP